MKSLSRYPPSERMVFCAKVVHTHTHNSSVNDVPENKRLEERGGPGFAIMVTKEMISPLVL